MATLDSGTCGWPEGGVQIAAVPVAVWALLFLGAD